DISVIVIQHAVAVEEGGGAPLPFGKFAPRPRQVRKHPDIDEIPFVDEAAQPPRYGESREQVALERTLGGDALHHGAAQRVDAAAYQPRPGPRRPLGKPRDPVSGDGNEAVAA